MWHVSNLKVLTLAEGNLHGLQKIIAWKKIQYHLPNFLLKNGVNPWKRCTKFTKFENFEGFKLQKPTLIIQNWSEFSYKIIFYS